MVLATTSGRPTINTSPTKSKDRPVRRRTRFAEYGPSRKADEKRLGGEMLLDGGLVGGMLRRQATGRRGGVIALGSRDVLFARGEFKKRMRRQLEGIPELISDVRKALDTENHGSLFTAVRAILTKLVEGTSAPFDMAVRQDSTSGPSSARNGGHNHAHGGPGAGGGGVDGAVGGGGEGHHHGGVGGGGGGHRHGDDEDDPFHSNGYPRVRRLDRDVFVALGGAELLIEVIQRPQWSIDARHIPADVVARDTPVWNITLCVLRELCFTDQDLSDRLGSSQLILFLLTMMGHPGVFDNAVGLVEEILAVKPNTYFLGEVPDLHSLVDNMSSQQLAHFSRVLALLVFEPEYRQLMESAHVLRSMELLQLRRDRVVRADSVIDKNQALVLSAPNLLPRLMELLRVMNYNPPLAVFEENPMEIQEHQFAQIRIGVVGTEGEGEIRRGLQQQAVASEWAYLAELRAAAGADPAPGMAPRTRSTSSVAEPLRQDSRRGNAGGGEPSRIVNFFRSFFRRNNSQRADAENDSTGNRAAGVAGGAAGVAVGDGDEPLAGAAVVEAGADGVGPDGLANFAVRDLMNFLNPNAAEGMVSLERALAWSVGGTVMAGGVGMANGRLRNRRRLQQPSSVEAREELQLNGLMLAPHQVEVLFVLCTLLGARRKGEAHEALAKLGLIEVLDAMFDRLSWGVPSRQEGPHGAHCDCNPESALRVQYLRLVHNFLDRDSNNNPLKRLLLSPHERELFASGRFTANPNGSGNVVFVKLGASESDAPQSPFVWRGRAESWIPGQSDEEKAAWVDTRGLLSKIVDVFMKEPMDSLYRFWLASCVEAFLRGGTTQEQLFIAGGGLLGHLVKEITSDGLWCAGSLQTAFDLLGELCKGNREVLEMLEASMTEKQLRRFLEVMVDNLVDSNVFMRSLVLSVEHSTFRHPNGAAGSGHDLWRTSGREVKVPRIRVDDSAPRGAAAVQSFVDSVTHVGDCEGHSQKDGDDYRGETSEEGGALGKSGGEGFQGLGAGEEPCYLGHTWFDVQTREVSFSVDSDTEEDHVDMGEEDVEGGRENRSANSRDEDLLSSDAATAATDDTTMESLAKQESERGGQSPAAARCTEHECRFYVGEEGEQLDSEQSQQRRNTVDGVVEVTDDGRPSYTAPGTLEGQGQMEDVNAMMVEGAKLPSGGSSSLSSGIGAAGSGRRAIWGAGEGISGLTRLQIFLKHNTPQLVRDLMGVVNLETINHENICCLNTAVLILIFADRRGQLAKLVREVRQLPAGKKVSDVDADDDDGSGTNEADGGPDSDSLFTAYSRERRRRAHHQQQQQHPDARRHGDAGAGNKGGDGGESSSAQADGETVLKGFRRLLWFWGEYYMRGGRDRLSLEFSTHVKFWAWKRVIRLLCADDGSPTALVAVPLRLPRSPYDTMPSPHLAPPSSV